MRIRVDDVVIVIRGNDQGSRGRVLSVDRAKNKVVVEGVNRVWKHVRPSQRNPQGGRLHMEMPIDVSNVMLVCPACGQPTKVGYRLLKDGGKVRRCRRASCDRDIDKA